MSTSDCPLEELARDGYCVDEWSRWQQGQCGTYATALIKMRPDLRLGIIGSTYQGGGDASRGWSPSHWVAHDGTYAYDSAGRHRLPYLGVHSGDNDYAEWGGDPEDWGLMDEEGTNEHDVAAAQGHARRNGILTRDTEQGHD